MSAEQHLPPTALEQRKSPAEKTPTDLRAEFREQWKESYRGELPLIKEGQTINGATEKVEAYEVFFDPYSPGERGHYLSGFGLQAMQAGFEITEAVSFTIPVVSVTVKAGETPAPGSIPPASEATPRTFVTYFLKSPIEGQPPTLATPPQQ